MRIFTLFHAAVATAIVTASSAWSAELVMISRHGCHWCQKWEEEIGKVYPNTDEAKRAPLQRFDINALPENISFTSRPVYTPTFILIHEGQELGRIEGYPGEDFFWPMFGQLLDAHPEETVPQS
jgi:hypothetical protein